MRDDVWLRFGLLKKLIYVQPFLSKIHRNHWTLYTNCYLDIIWSQWDWGCSGMCLKPLFCCWDTPQGFFSVKHNIFRQKTNISFFRNKYILSKTRFLGNLFGERSHNSCLYGPYEPFRCSVKSEFWHVNFNRIQGVRGKPTFPDLCENDWFV